MNKRLFKPGSRRHATLRDVARHVGLSVSVVSRALNRSPDRNARVAPETIQKIAEAAKALNFHRNRAAEFVKRGALPTIGVFVPEAANRLIADLLFGISEIAREEDFPLQIDSDLSLKGFRRFMQHNLDLAHSGVISYPALLSQPEVAREVERFRAGGGKVVLLNSALEISGVPVVAMDERLGGRLAAERLLARNCKSFALAGEFRERVPGFEEKLNQMQKSFRNPPRLSATPPQEGIFLAAGRSVRGGTSSEKKAYAPLLGGVREAGGGSDITERYSIAKFPEDESGLRELVNFCKSAKKPVGVFAVNDKLALMIIRSLREAGLEVGRETLVVGYDDLELAAEADPPLTTIHQPFREEGRLAARKLINLIYGVNEKSEMVSPRLVARDSG